MNIDARSLQCREETKDNYGGESEADAKEQNPHVHFNDGFRGNRKRGHVRVELADARPREQTADDCSAESEKQTFQKKLAHQAGAAGTQTESLTPSITVTLPLA